LIARNPSIAAERTAFLTHIRTKSSSQLGQNSGYTDRDFGVLLSSSKKMLV